MIDRPAHTPRQRSGGRFSGDTGMGPEEPAKAIKDSRGYPPLVPRPAVVSCPDHCAWPKAKHPTGIVQPGAQVSAKITGSKVQAKHRDKLQVAKAVEPCVGGKGI